MKKRLLMILFLLMIFTTGCFKYDSKDALNDLDKKYKNLKAYHIEGELEIVNNEDTFKYDVDVKFKKDDQYRVSLKNKNNNHEQIILKNTEGVYVLTPSLNKSFKFQSDWPYNNSQVYLIRSILDDIKNDKEKDFVEKEDSYIITTTVNYPNNRKLVRQVVTLDKKMNFKEVKVVDESDITQMRMIFTNIDLSPNIESDTFNLNSIMKNNIQTPTQTPTTSPNPSASPNESASPTTSPTPSTSPNPNASPSPSETPNQTPNNTSETGVLEDIIYPLYIPTGTKLTNQETIKKNDGKRVIMTFDGEKPFLLVEETSSIPDDFEIIPTFGEPCILTDTVASLTDTSITWSSSGVDYYLVSDVMSQDELLEIARSVSVIPTMK